MFDAQHNHRCLLTPADNPGRIIQHHNGGSTQQFNLAQLRDDPGRACGCLHSPTKVLSPILVLEFIDPYFYVVEYGSNS
ncbi:MAG: hypothetical protein ABI618_08205 [Nitrospirota bacterium]